jgi:hypothetical protein
MNWKAQLGIGLLVVAVAVAGVWLWRDSVWRERIVSSPVVRDTVQVVRVDTVRVPRIVIKRVEVVRIDSTPDAPRWYRAAADTTVSGYGLHFEYLSPLPLSESGYFANIAIDPPVRMDSVRTVTVTETRTVIDERLDWNWVLGALGTGVSIGAFVVMVAQ